MAKSKRLQVLEAVKALVETALPNAEVLGLDSGDAKPDEIGPGGTVIVRAGDPGDADIDLGGPELVFNYSHAIPLEFGAYEAAGMTSEEVLDRMMGDFGRALKADPTLGGLCDYVRASAAVTDDFNATGAVAGRWGDLTVEADYATTDPLN
ncbi:MAG: hypothetical protein JSS35_10670 [Proteobacteria bacterium]|nr:hypothetical protein [Pseudomonadota bacterium]